MDMIEQCKRIERDAALVMSQARQSHSQWQVEEESE